MKYRYKVSFKFKNQSIWKVRCKTCKKVIRKNTGSITEVVHAIKNHEVLSHFEVTDEIR